MSSLGENKTIVGRWFTEFWGEKYNPAVVDHLAVPAMLLQYSMHNRRRGREEVKAFMTEFRKAFPDLNFRVVGELATERDFVIVRWEGGGTHTGPAFDDFQLGPLPAASGWEMRLAGHTAIRLETGMIAEEAVWTTERKDHMRSLVEASGIAE